MSECVCVCVFVCVVCVMNNYNALYIKALNKVLQILDFFILLTVFSEQKTNFAEASLIY